MRRQLPPRGWVDRVAELLGACRRRVNDEPLPLPPALAAISFITNSAIGLRQMLPWQMNKIFFIAKFHYPKNIIYGSVWHPAQYNTFSPTLQKCGKTAIMGEKTQGALEWSCKRGGLRTRRADWEKGDPHLRPAGPKLGVAYERVDHAPAMTMEVCQEIDQTLQAVICKNLFLCNRQETAFYLLMIPDTKVFPYKAICLHRSARRACPLPSRNTWKSFWILRPARSACWD